MRVQSGEKPRRAAAHLAFVAILGASVLSSCLADKKGLLTKDLASVVQKQQCVLPNAVAVKNIANRLIASGVDVASSDLCAKPENYACYSHIFSPTAVDGQSTEQECASAPELGGDFCMKLATRTYSTLEASSRPDTAPGAIQPGGELNRSDYVCDQHQLKDGSNELAIGEGATLREAMLASYAKCVAVTPLLTTANP